MEKKYTSVLFDLDGTLTDSGPGIMRCARCALDELNVSVAPDADLRTFVGPPLRKTFPEFGVPEDRVEEAVEIYRRHYHKGNGKFENYPYPGIEDLLSRLRAEGLHLYVATSKPEKLSIEILKHFSMDHWFDLICGATEDGSRDAKADVIRYLLDRIEDPDSAVMVGDTVYDVTGAAALSLPCIAVSWGYGHVSEMKAAGAAAVADTPEALGALLLGQA